MDATPTFARFTSTRGLTHQPGLDGVRGLAVSAVVAFHLGIANVSGGYLGVSLFFTMSGVLIGTSILNEVVTTGRFSLPGFWRRRARRLLPPALLTLAVVAVGRLVTTDLEATSRTDIVASGLNVANWHLLANGSSYEELFSGPSALLHFWSLAIEEQFYLVVGLLAVLVAGRSRRPVRTVFIVATSAAAASSLIPIVTQTGVDRIYYGSDTRAGELMAGVAAAAVFMSPERRAVLLAKARWLGVAATGALGATIALWAFTTPGTELLRRGLLPLTATCSLLVVVGALMPVGPVATIARSRPLRWLGVLSYTLYLVHWPVIVVADRLTDSRAWWRSAAIVVVAVAIAQLSAILLERPVRRRHVSARPLAFGVATTLAIGGAAVVVEGRATQPAALLGSLSSAAAAPPPAEPASTGESGSPRVALFGDSIGFSLLLALGDTTVTPQFERAPSAVSLGCGIALSPAPPTEPPGACDNPAQRFAATATGHDLSGAVMISCQWELLAQPLPGRGDARYVIGHPAFDSYVRLRYEDVADRLTAAGVDRILWMTCPYFSSAVGVDGLSPRFRDSRAPARIDRLNGIITAMANERADVDVLPFGEWVNKRVDDAAIRPDGSHYEHRVHNPAADAFIRYINAAL